MNNELRKAWRSTLRKLNQARKKKVMLEERLAQLPENETEEAKRISESIYDLKIRISVLELRESTRRKEAGVV